MSLSKIRVLDDHTINKIAAGEVIENPASVVKELVENALDAGATEICVEIKGGGRQLIRVTDNGCGMIADDALLSLERHATSKIREVEDIQSLLTMGFRGEAIPSIASISKFTLLTAPFIEGKKNTDGTLIMGEGGRILSCVPAARSPGTTFEIKSLFFNVPVRKKFQRSPSYDTQEIFKMLSVLSLGYPAIKFELISDQKPLLSTSISSTTSSLQQLLSERIEKVLGNEFSTQLTPLSFEKEPYSLEGYIGLPTTHRPNRTSQYLFINQRAVHAPLISFAVKEGYGTALPPNRYPVFVLHLRLPGSLVDVNVHPQKKEVRLRQEHVLKELLLKSIQNALHQQGFEQPREAALTQPYFSPYEEILQNSSFMFHEAKEDFSFSPSVHTHAHIHARETPDDAPFEPCFTPSILAETPEPNVRYFSTRKPEPPASPELWAPIPIKKRAPRLLAAMVNFILIDPMSLESTIFQDRGSTKRDGLYIIDQKAAHGRIHYERLLKQLQTKEKAENYIQPLLVPMTVDFSPLETTLLKEQLPLLNQMGFGIQEFGERTFIIDAIPDCFRKEDIATYLSALVQDLADFHDTRLLQREKEKQLALLSSRLSVPKDKKLSLEEGQALLDQLVECEMPFQCPFGKQIFVCLSQEELAKYFQK